MQCCRLAGRSHLKNDMTEPINYKNNKHYIHYIHYIQVISKRTFQLLKFYFGAVCNLDGPFYSCVRLVRYCVVYFLWFFEILVGFCQCSTVYGLNDFFCRGKV